MTISPKESKETPIKNVTAVETRIPATVSSEKKIYPSRRNKRLAQPEIGPGWTEVIKWRKATRTRPSYSYKNYLSPQEKFVLYSRMGVDRFLAALETVNGDETKAYAIIKGGTSATAHTTADTIANTTAKAAAKATTKATTESTAKTTKATTKIATCKATCKATTETTAKTTAKAIVRKKTTTKEEAVTPTTPKPRQKNQQNPQEIYNNDPFPKRPSTTYLMYTCKIRSKITAENPNSSPAKISRILGVIWKAVPEKERNALKVDYLEKLEIYKGKVKEWELRNPGKKRGRSLTRDGKTLSSPKDKSSASSIPSKKAKTTAQNEPKWWEVEGFRDRRVNQSTGKEEYLIKWRGCPESSNTWEPACNLNVQDDAKEWWKQETIRRNNLILRQKHINESMKRLGLDGGSLSSSDDECETKGPEMQQGGADVPTPLAPSNFCKRSEAPPASTKTSRAAAPLVEDKTWKWDDASQINFRTIRRISVNDSTAKEEVTEARINGTPVVLTGHVGWANFALRWLRKHQTDVINHKDTSATAVAAAGTDAAGKVSTQQGDDSKNRGDMRGSKNDHGHSNGAGTEGGVIPMKVSREEKGVKGEHNVRGGWNENGDLEPIPYIGSELSAPSAEHTSNDKSEQMKREGTHRNNGECLQADQDRNKKPMIKTTESSMIEENSNDSKTGAEANSNKPLDLSDPAWYLDIEAMSNDIGDEVVPVVRKNYNESKPISGNILASKFFEAGWKMKKEQSTSSSSSSSSSSSGRKRKTVLYLHQWQFPLSVEAGQKLCHQNAPLPNNILGEDLLKYWLDRVKLDSPLQYLFMGNADTMSKIHRDNGGLAISIAPITGEKECILVHRDDGHACLYHNQAPLDPDDIDLNAYPLLPHARIWKSTIEPGEILLMPHGTYHQCRNVTPCLSYSRFHLDGINLRAFFHSMMDGDAPELNQDEVLWNATRELIDVVDKASDEKRPVDQELVKAVDALRALRNIAKEVTRKLQVRQTVKGTEPFSAVISSSVNIDGDAEIWLSLVDDVDMCLHEFRYRFNKKIPSFKRRRSIGRKILALPALPFRGKFKPSEKELKQGRNQPVVAFECPSDRGFLALPEAPSEVSPAERKQVDDAVDSIVVGDNMMVRIEGRKCPARVTEVLENARAAWICFEDLPLLYNDFVACDLLRTPSIGGSCLSEPQPEDIKPGKLFVCLMGKDEYRGVVQHVKSGRFFKSKLDFGNGHSIDKLIDPESILSLTRQSKRPVEKDDMGASGRKRRKRSITQEVSKETSTEHTNTTSTKQYVSDSNPIPNTETEHTKGEKLPMKEAHEEETEENAYNGCDGYLQSNTGKLPEAEAIVPTELRTKELGTST